MQFKLVEKETFKTGNTFTFVNMPLAKQGDNNVHTLLEILKKFKAQSKTKKKTRADFIPFNKSILTRVMAHQL